MTPLSAAELATLPTADAAALQALATQLGVTTVAGLDRRDLLVAILLQHCALGGEVTVCGAVDVLPDGSAFLRAARHGYAPGVDDVFVSQTQVRHLGLRQGHEVAGPARPPGEGERYFALMRVVTVDGQPVERLPSQLAFAARTPLLPQRRLDLDLGAAPGTLRAIAALAPWGLGQRVLVTAPAAVDRVALLAALAVAARRGNPEIRILFGACDQRPEELAALRPALAATGAELAGSPFDAPAARHVALGAMLLARGQRLVESGRDVLLLFDSLTALARACNLDTPPTGRQLSPGLDVGALLLGKRLFAAARACAEGGTLTVVATALADGTRLDAAIRDELLGRGNSEVALRADGWPDPVATATRREDLLLPADERERLDRLRDALRTADAAAFAAQFAAANPPGRDRGRQRGAR